MYGFNGQVPGPLVRVPQNATITVRFHNRIDLPSTVHWHGVRLDNRFDGVPGLAQGLSGRPRRATSYTRSLPGRGHLLVSPAHARRDIEQAMGLFGDMRVDSPDRDYYSPVNREETLLLDNLYVNGDTLIPFREGGARLRADGPRRQRTPRSRPCATRQRPSTSTSRALQRPRVERTDDVPVGRRDEQHALASRVRRRARRGGLDAPGGESRIDLLPQHGRDLLAVQPVEDAAGLLRVDEPLVDLAGLPEARAGSRPW